MLVIFGVYSVAVTALGDTCMCVCHLWGVQCGRDCLGGYRCECVLVVFGVYSVAVTVSGDICMCSRHLCGVQSGSDCLGAYLCVCCLWGWGVQCGSYCLRGYLCVCVLFFFVHMYIIILFLYSEFELSQRIL